MLKISKLEELRAYVGRLKKNGARIGFVPTMGFLHEGHLSLMRLAAREADEVIVSIFVNPAQFNDPRDYEKYPMDLERDSALLEREGVNVLFAPSREAIYGDVEEAGMMEDSFQTWVALDRLPLPYEGACRPGHFKGVSTVVSILFNLVQPGVAVFGEKDFQQLRIIEQMVADLKYDIKIVRGPLIREPDGLAMSSRNVRLSSTERESALLLSQGLHTARSAFKDGEKQSSNLCGLVHECLQSSPLVRPEYVAVVNEQTLQPIPRAEENARMLVAAFVGEVRLIDNLALREE